MDLYLPDEFYALSEVPNARNDRERTVSDDADWLGGEAFVAADTRIDARRDEPDPIWRVV
ncbi:MAG TPA: hypothetical protein VHC92_00800 [Rhodanobacteraceae bacterium]|jgi:hypothetical protein|nr:hypothetical protein [Rhodanobacteraceae bacterium]